jgi:hypothetical protein
MIRKNALPRRTLLAIAAAMFGPFNGGGIHQPRW